MMVDPGIIASLIVLIFLCFAIPIGGFIYLSVKKKHVAKPFFIGMLVFFVFQMVIRLPVIQLVLPQTAWFIAMSRNPWLYGLFMGGTAAITEELERYIAVRFWLKKNRRYADGIAYGLGHGGIEAMLLIGVNNIANLFIVLSRSTYMAALIAVQLNYTTIYITLFERVLAIIVQVGPFYAGFLCCAIRTASLFNLRIGYSHNDRCGDRYPANCFWGVSILDRGGCIFSSCYLNGLDGKNKTEI